MSVAILTQLSQVKDYPTARTLRLIADALDTLASAMAQMQKGGSTSLTKAQLDQIKAALEASGTHPLQLAGLTVSGLTSFVKAANEWLDSFDASTGLFTGSQPAASNLSNGTTGSGAVVLAGSPTITGHPTIEGVTSTGATGTGNLVFDGSPTLTTPTLGVATGSSLKLTASAPATAAGQLGLGKDAGFGAGAAGTAVTTTTKGGGTGPTTAETVVNYLKITLGGADYYIPLMQ